MIKNKYIRDLRFKEYNGEIVRALTGSNFGFYEVKVPELFPDGSTIIAYDATQKRLYDSESGQYFPLIPGQKVVIKFRSNNINSAYIDRILENPQITELHTKENLIDHHTYIVFHTPYFNYCKVHDDKGNFHLSFENDSSLIDINRNSMSISTSGKLDISAQGTISIYSASNIQIFQGSPQATKKEIKSNSVKILAESNSFPTIAKNVDLVKLVKFVDNEISKVYDAEEEKQFEEEINELEEDTENQNSIISKVTKDLNENSQNYDASDIYEKGIKKLNKAYLKLFENEVEKQRIYVKKLVADSNKVVENINENIDDLLEKIRETSSGVLDKLNELNSIDGAPDELKDRITQKTKESLCVAKRIAIEIFNVDVIDVDENICTLEYVQEVINVDTDKINKAKFTETSYSLEDFIKKITDNLDNVCETIKENNPIQEATEKIDGICEPVSNIYKTNEILKNSILSEMMELEKKMLKANSSSPFVSGNNCEEEASALNTKIDTKIKSDFLNLKSSSEYYIDKIKTNLEKLTEVTVDNKTLVEQKKKSVSLLGEYIDTLTADLSGIHNTIEALNTLSNTTISESLSTGLNNEIWKIICKLKLDLDLDLFDLDSYFGLNLNLPNIQLGMSEIEIPGSSSEGAPLKAGGCIDSSLCPPSLNLNSNLAIPDLFSVLEDFASVIVSSLFRELFGKIIELINEILDGLHTLFSLLNEGIDLLNRGISFSLGMHLGLYATLLDLSKLTSKLEFKKCLSTNLNLATGQFFSKLT